MPLFGCLRGIWGDVDSPAPVDLREPKVPATPLIVEVPHAGTFVDELTRATLAVDASAIARDADLFVDELYALAPTVGATLITTPFSRYVVDLNRGETDLDEATMEGGPREPRATRGLVWRLTSDNRRAITRPLTRAEVDRRLDLLYRPYHAALRRLIDERRARFGFAIVLAGHSMPGTGRAGHGDAARVRADVVPGTRGRTSAADVFIDAVDSQARAAGFTVARHALSRWVHDDALRPPGRQRSCRPAGARPPALHERGNAGAHAGEIRAFTCILHGSRRPARKREALSPEP